DTVCGVRENAGGSAGPFAVRARQEVWPMAASYFTRSIRRAAAAAVTVVALAAAPSALAKGPESVADVAEVLLDSVVNISTSQTVTGSRGIQPPTLPDGSPFQDFFNDFFDDKAPGAQPDKIGRASCRERV